MRPPAPLLRGSVFRAEHDETFEEWVRDEPRAKFCVVFNVAPPQETNDVHYFMCTKNVARFTENPQLLSDCLILPKDSYGFFDKPTAIDFSQLWVVPLAKLRAKRLTIVGVLSAADIGRCAAVISQARILAPKSKKLLGL